MPKVEELAGIDTCGSAIYKYWPAIIAVLKAAKADWGDYPEELRRTYAALQELEKL